jgi:plasmid maintenance system antidote protein VapI
VRFREAVAAEFERRRGHNRRYSLRAFARALGVHHATMSRLLATTRPVQARTVRTLGPRLGLSSSRIVAMVSLEDAASVAASIARPSFRPDSRWLASVAGIPVDRVNIALQGLLRSGRLRMPSVSRWLLTQP